MLGGLSQSQYLGMGAGVVIGDRGVATTPNDHAVLDHDGADRHFACLRGLFG